MSRKQTREEAEGKLGFIVRALVKIKVLHLKYRPYQNNWTVKPNRKNPVYWLFVPVFLLTGYLYIVGLCLKEATEEFIEEHKGLFVETSKDTLVDDIGEEYEEI